MPKLLVFNNSQMEVTIVHEGGKYKLAHNTSQTLQDVFGGVQISVSAAGDLAGFVKPGATEVQVQNNMSVDIGTREERGSTYLIFTPSNRPVN
jgi:hypothetical protein